MMLLDPLADVGLVAFSAQPHGLCPDGDGHLVKRDREFHVDLSLAEVPATALTPVEAFGRFGLEAVQDARPENRERVATATAVDLLEDAVHGLRISVGHPVIPESQYFLAPVADSRQEGLEGHPHVIRQAFLPLPEGSTSLSPALDVIECVEALLDGMRLSQPWDVLQPAIEFELLLGGQTAVALEKEMAGPHQLAPSLDVSLASCSLSAHVEAVVSHPDNMEFVNNYSGVLAKDGARSVPIGRPHVDTDDLDALPTAHLRQPVSYAGLPAGADQVEDRAVAQVGEDGPQFACDHHLIHAKNVRREDRVRALHLLHGLAGDQPDRSLGQADLVGDVRERPFQGGIADVFDQPGRHSAVVVDVRKGLQERLLALLAPVALAINPDCDGLPTDGGVSVIGQFPAVFVDLPDHAALSAGLRGNLVFRFNNKLLAVFQHVVYSPVIKVKEVRHAAPRSWKRHLAHFVLRCGVIVSRERGPEVIECSFS